MGKNIPDYTLDHPRVQAARRKYRQAHPLRSKSAGTFEKLLPLYRSPLSFGEISRATGLSRRYVELAYPHFKPFCGNRTAVERRAHVAQQKQNHQRTLVERSLHSHPHVRAVTKRAEEYGLKVRYRAWLSFHAKGWVPYARYFRINWAACALFWSRSAYVEKRGNQHYARFRIYRTSVAKATYVIFYVAEEENERMFIVPAQELVPAVFSRDQESALVNIPLRRKKSNGGVKARLNFLDYEDAWHLIKEPDYEEPPT